MLRRRPSEQARQAFLSILICFLNSDIEEGRRIGEYLLGMANSRRFSCRAPEIASGLPFSGAKAFGQGQRFTNILSNFLVLFLFKSPMAGMNRLFEQDLEFPHFGSREDQLAFYSAKIALSEEQKKSGSAPTAGGPIRKPRRSKAVLKLQYSKQCNSVKKSVVWNSSDDEPIFPHSMSDPDDNEPIFRRDKKPGDLSNSIVEPTPLAVNIHVRAQIQRIRQGATNVVLIRPLADANLATDVEMLVRECINVPHVASVELQVSNTVTVVRSGAGLKLSCLVGRELHSAQWTGEP
jgi:hypothetical protein